MRDEDSTAQETGSEPGIVPGAMALAAARELCPLGGSGMQGPSSAFEILRRCRFGLVSDFERQSSSFQNEETPP